MAEHVYPRRWNRAGGGGTNYWEQVAPDARVVWVVCGNPNYWPSAYTAEQLEGMCGVTEITDHHPAPPAEQPPFKHPQRVRDKLGGDEYTVHTCQRDGDYWMVWFTKGTWLPASRLVLVEPPELPPAVETATRSTWRCPHCGGYDAGGIDLHCSGCGRPGTPVAHGVDGEEQEELMQKELASLKAEGRKSVTPLLDEIRSLRTRLEATQVAYSEEVPALSEELARLRVLYSDLARQLGAALAERDEATRTLAQVAIIASGEEPDDPIPSAACDAVRRVVREVAAEREQRGMRHTAWNEAIRERDAARNSVANMLSQNDRVRQANTDLSAELAAAKRELTEAEKDRHFWYLETRKEADARIAELAAVREQNAALRAVVEAVDVAEKHGACVLCYKGNGLESFSGAVAKWLSDWKKARDAALAAPTAGVGKKPQLSDDDVAGLATAYRETERRPSRISQMVAELRRQSQQAWQRLDYATADRLAALIGDDLPSDHEKADLTPAPAAPEVRG